MYLSKFKGGNIMNGKVLLAVLFALMLSLSLQPAQVWADDDAIMDQDNPYYISQGGNWSVSSWAPCATGGGYYFAWGSDDSITYETYETADITGEYAVYARWTSHANRNDNARYRIYDGASTLRSTVYVDQREDGCNWQWLDTITLTNGNKGRVILDNPGATGSEATIADGVRFVRITKDGADILNGSISPVDAGFNYAGSSSKGGPALDLTCTTCVSQGELNFTPGDITGVTAGTGLSGGGLSGNVTLNANTTYLQRRVSSSCPAGESIRVISSTGGVTCETDDTGGTDSDWTISGNNMSSAVSGNVGIGTTSFAHKLEVVGANNNYMRAGTPWEGVFGQSTGGRGVVGFSDSGDGVMGKHINSDNSGKLGTASEGVYGYSSAGTGGYFSSGSGLALHSSGDSRFDIGSWGDSITITTPGSWPGIIAHTIIPGVGDHRRDIAFTDAGVRIIANSTSGLPSNVNQLLVKENGYVSVKVLEIRSGADLSEKFDVKTNIDDIEPLPGMVVSIDPENPGELVVSSSEYDRRVAGIISGAGGVSPGMLMGQTGSIADGSSPVALTGRVYCRVDASQGTVEPGDLLTTSTTPGHAMKVTDHSRANGAIIGKAMTSLDEGKGLVLVLVTLQ
jgi:hypothetical protein